MFFFLVFFSDGYYWFKNVYIFFNLVKIKVNFFENFQFFRFWEDLGFYYLEIVDGKIKNIVVVGQGEEFDLVIDDGVFRVDLSKRMILFCFVDMYIYLDKGYIWGRLLNVDGIFFGVIVSMERDVELYYSLEDIYCRMEFVF